MHIFNELQKRIKTIPGFAARLLKPQKADKPKGRCFKYLSDKRTAGIIVIISAASALAVFVLHTKKRRENNAFIEQESAEESISPPEYAMVSDACKSPGANSKPREKNTTLFLVLAIALILCALPLAFKATDYFSQMRKNAIINETVRVVASDAAAPSPAPAPPLATPASAPENPQDAPNSPQDGTEEAEPEPEPPKEILESITKLRDVFSNDDIVALLKIEGTNIEYAVAQSSDNEFYLNRDLYGADNAAGSIFMDYECDPLDLSRNTVIYGHNMRNGTMFHNIRYYAQKEYYENHRYIQLTTPYEETVWEIFSFYQTDTSFYYIQVLFKNDEEFLNLISKMKEKSIYETSVSVDENDKVLTLSTCANTPDDARLVLNAKLVSSSGINNFKNL